MRAIRVHTFGGIDRLQIDDVPQPVPGPGQLLVKVKTAGVGPWDAWIREGQSALGQAPPLTLGSDVSGVIVGRGEGVSDLAIGDQIYGVTNREFTGGYAEYALVEAGRVAPKPDSLDDVSAASLPVVSVTAWQMLNEHARVVAAQTILVRGAGGSVGTAVTQIAIAAGAKVIGTCHDGDFDRVRAMGVEPVSDDTAHGPFDAVLDTIGGKALDRFSRELRPGGMLVSAVRAPDPDAARQHRVRTGYFLVDVTRDRLEKISDLVTRGLLKPWVGEVLELAEAASAHEMLSGKPHKPGKIVLRVAD